MTKRRRLGSENGRFGSASIGDSIAELVGTVVAVAFGSWARSLAPAVLSMTFSDLWIYLLGPPAGALIAAAVYRATRRSVPCAKLVHTEGYQCHFQNCAYRQKPAG
ncbi:MAG: aquaporin [Acidimicrobiales bacterium]